MVKVSFLAVLLIKLVHFSCDKSRNRLLSEAEFETTDSVGMNKENICGNSSPLIVVIKSAARHFELRTEVRETWLPQLRRRRVPYVFALGHSEKFETNVLDEDKKHGDLISGIFEEDYFNLTLKTTFVLKWTQRFCPNKWLLYVDDDTIINVSKLLEFMVQIGANYSGERRIFCATEIFPVQRSFHFWKWQVSRDIFAADYYPMSCSGHAMVLSPSSIGPLTTASMDRRTVPKLWIDDVYLTAFAAPIAGVKLLNSEHFTFRDVHERLKVGEIAADDLVALGDMDDYEWTFRDSWDYFQFLKGSKYWF